MIIVPIIATTIETLAIIIIILSGIGPLVGTLPSIGGDDDDKDDNSIITRLTMLTVCLSERVIFIKSTPELVLSLSYYRVFFLSCHSGASMKLRDR